MALSTFKSLVSWDSTRVPILVQKRPLAVYTCADTYRTLSAPGSTSRRRLKAMTAALN